MPTSLIYAIVVLIWGTTWFVIKFQLGVVEAEISLVYRFALAAACVFAYARVTGSPLALSWRGHHAAHIRGVVGSIPTTATKLFLASGPGQNSP